MNDPHVKTLCYRVETAPDSSFVKPPPVDFETLAFKLRLENGIARVEMKEHHASEDSARVSVEEFLYAWEIDDGLRRGRGEFRFVFQGSEVIDRNPPPGVPSGQITASASATGNSSLTVSARVARAQYPTPPSTLRASQDVRTLWMRYSAYQDGRETLAAMAYYCLTVIEKSAGPEGAKGLRGKAATLYAIDLGILDALGNLTADVGDDATARKKTQGPSNRPYSGDERKFIEEAIKLLIRRKAEYDFAPIAPLRRIERTELPALASEFYDRT